MLKIILLKLLPDSIHLALMPFTVLHMTYICLLLKYCLQRAVIREIY